jgi:hypothetical protein
MVAQTIKAISLYPPWSEFIKLGAKRYETRSWQASYRGLIAIHASKRWTDEEKEAAAMLHRQFPAIPLIENPTLGAVLCICRMLDCVRTESISPSVSAHERAVGGWATGRWAWEMEVLEVFDTPIPLRGQQGLFDWEFPTDFLEKRIAIVGSRDYEDLDAVKRYVCSLPKDVTIVSGGARGVDTVAVDTAKERGMKTVVIPVNQRGLPEGGLDRNNMFGQRAMQRNGEIVQMVGTVAAFWDSKSPGTANTIERAEKAGKIVLINPNVVVKEVAAKQLMFEGFKSTYDEGAYITALERVKHFSPEDEKKKDEPFEWSTPWLVGNQVWVWDGWKDGKRNYRLVPKDSPAARMQASFLQGFFYGGNTHELREWLDEQLGEIPVPGFVADIGDMASSYMLRDGAIVEDIPFDKLVLTQSHYLMKHWRRYNDNFTIKDQDGKLAYGMRFSDSDSVYVSDGTHRVLVARSRKHSSMKIEVNTFPETFAQACQAIEIDDSEEERLELIAELLREAYAIIQESKEKELEPELIPA